MRAAFAALSTVTCLLTPDSRNTSLVTLSMAPQLLMIACWQKSKLAGGNCGRTIDGFLHDDQGQDLIEYTLLLAFVCLASAALFISAGGSVGGIWTQANTRLTAANAAAAS